jgi:hypothetical protein
MPNNQTVDYSDQSKTDFQRKCKFTLCFESTKNEGFITEKITDAFYADTIPIYYGSSTITDYYNLEFLGLETIGSEELFGIAHTMYDIFISRFTNYMVDFYTGYIMKNIDSIYAYLYNDDNVKKPREKDMPVKSYIDPKFQLIHANLNTVILNTAAYDISLEDLLFSFTDNNIATRLLSVLSDKGDIYKNYYASFLLDQRYMAELLTSIKLKLQELTQQAIEIK